MELSAVQNSHSASAHEREAAHAEALDDVRAEYITQLEQQETHFAAQLAAVQASAETAQLEHDEQVLTLKATMREQAKATAVEMSRRRKERREKEKDHTVVETELARLQQENELLHQLTAELELTTEGLQEECDALRELVATAEADVVARDAEAATAEESLRAATETAAESAATQIQALEQAHAVQLAEEKDKVATLFVLCLPV